MGGYDEQTIAGVVVDLDARLGAAAGGRSRTWCARSTWWSRAARWCASSRPAGSPTRRASAASARLIQDDDTFLAAVCGIGTLGLIHSLVIEVREKFWLNEVRTLDTWEDVRDTRHARRRARRGRPLRAVRQPVRGQRRRAPRAGDHARGDCAEPVGRAGGPAASATRSPSSSRSCRSPASCCASRRVTGRALLAWRFDSVLDGMADDGYANVSYKVFNIGEANQLPAVSMELGVTLEGNRHLEAVDRILAIAARAPEARQARPHLADRAALRRRRRRPTRR